MCVCVCVCMDACVHVRVSVCTHECMNTLMLTNSVQKVLEDESEVGGELLGQGLVLGDHHLTSIENLHHTALRARMDGCCRCIMHSMYSRRKKSL